VYRVCRLTFARPAVFELSTTGPRFLFSDPQGPILSSLSVLLHSVPTPTLHYSPRVITPISSSLPLMYVPVAVVARRYAVIEPASLLLVRSLASACARVSHDLPILRWWFSLFLLGLQLSGEISQACFERIPCALLTLRQSIARYPASFPCAHPSFAFTHFTKPSLPGFLFCPRRFSLLCSTFLFIPFTPLINALY